MEAYSNQDISKLNEFLKNELSAVATYDQCIEKVSNALVVRHLAELRSSHASRSRLLRDRVRALGGEPADDAGIWGSIAKLVEGGAAAFGEKAALSVLEEGEDIGLQQYQSGVDELSEATRLFVSNSILPEQRRSHDTLGRMIRAEA
jgi:hypothetical protein